MADADYFSFYTTGGTVNLNVNVAALGANLDARLELYQMRSILHPTGGIIQIPVMIASAAPSNSLGASLSVYVGAGTYYVAVKSHGTYGDLGQYTLTGAAPRWSYVFDTQYAVARTTTSSSASGFQAGALSSAQFVSAVPSGGGASATDVPTSPAPAGPAQRCIPIALPIAQNAATHEFFEKLGLLAGLGN